MLARNARNESYIEVVVCWPIQYLYRAVLSKGGVSNYYADKTWNDDAAECLRVLTILRGERN